MFREPIKTSFFEHDVYTVLSPAAGGPMIALMLKILGHEQVLDLSPHEQIQRFAAVLETADESRLRHVAGQAALSFSQEIEAFERKLARLGSS